MSDPVLWEQVDIDLPLAAERVCSVLPGTPADIARATGLPVTRVAQCLGWLERQGRAQWTDDPAGQGPGVWVAT